MKKISRTIAAACASSLLAFTALTGLSSCGGEKKTADGGVIPLTMYIIGDRPAGQDVNDENLNKLLKEKLGCTLTVNWIPWSDFTNKYPLLFSSGEEFDMAYTATWLNFTSLAQKGAFMNLDELWEKYAPKNFARQSEAAKIEATVDGHYYCVPTLMATYNAYGPIYRKDILEGTGWDGKMESFADIERYCELVKGLNNGMEPLDIYSMGSEWDDTYIASAGYRPSKNSTGDFLFYDPQQKNPKLITYYEFDGVNDFLSMMNRWNQKGFFPKSALADTDSTKIQNGKAALRTHNVDTYQGYGSMHPEWSWGYANMVKYTTHLPFVQDAMVIANTSKHPEKALELWDAITNDQEIFNAFFYGVKGVTYEITEAGEEKSMNADLYASSNMWAARTNEFYMPVVDTPADYEPLKASFEAATTATAEEKRAVQFEAFAIDTSKIETEYAACQNVHQQYWWPLELGYVDAKKGLAEYKTMMETAGIEKVRAEIQKQLDEYNASLK